MSILGSGPPGVAVFTVAVIDDADIEALGFGGHHESLEDAQGPPHLGLGDLVPVRVLSKRANNRVVASHSCRDLDLIDFAPRNSVDVDQADYPIPRLVRPHIESLPFWGLPVSLGCRCPLPIIDGSLALLGRKDKCPSGLDDIRDQLLGHGFIRLSRHWRVGLLGAL